MGDDTLDRDARIKLSIGTKQQGHDDGQLSDPSGLAFDHHRGLLFVADSANHRVQVFSCDDDDGGSFVSKFEPRDPPLRISDVAIDHDHDRILVTDTKHCQMQAWQLDGHCELKRPISSTQNNWNCPVPSGVAIDRHHQRVVVTNISTHKLTFMNLSDLSFLFEIGEYGQQHCEFDCPQALAIDDDRHRIIVSDSDNHRVQVLSSIDGSFLFEFGSKGDQQGQFNCPVGVCVDNQGRIIVADCYNHRLQSYTHEGHHISSFDCGSEYPYDVAFDEHRGVIAFIAGNRVHVIGTNQWLADTFSWRPDRHRYAPSWMKQAISTMTMIRSLVDECSSMSMIPNELLFEIFSHL